MTMRELAKLANVSISTVSKAFNEAEDINEKTKQHIFALAKQHGCYGQFYKGKYPEKVIAIICPEINSNYYAQLIDHLSKQIEASGALCLVSADHFSVSAQAKLIEYFISFLKVDGLIVFSLRSHLKKAYDTPIVSLFGTAENDVDSVRVDIEKAMREAISLFTEYGHTSIAFIGENLTQSKVKLFEAAMLAAGNEHYTLVQSNRRFEKAGIDGVQQLLKTGARFSALVCAYDEIAYGAIKELRKHGIAVPQDVSVVGIENSTTSEYTETSLTTIDTRPEDMCTIAWDLLQKKLKNKYFRVRQSIMVSPKLILRESLAQHKEKTTLS